MTRHNPPLLKVAEQEVYKISGVALLMVFIQLIFSILGFTGFINALFLYGLAAIASSMFTVDFDGIKSTKGVVYSASAHGTSVLIDLLMVGTGFITWFLVGFIQGIDSTLAGGAPADDALQKMSGGNFLLKLLYAFISHLTMFAFVRLWINSFDGIVSLVSPPPKPPTGTGKPPGAKNGGSFGKKR